MAETYITKAGDQWDMIAKSVYGDELYADYLMEKNLMLVDTFEFSAGVVMNTPDLPEDREGTLPPWRTSEDTEDEE